MRYPLLCLPVLLQPQSPACLPLHTRYRKHRRSSGCILQWFVARLTCLPHISEGSSPRYLMSNHCGAWRVAPELSLVMSRSAVRVRSSALLCGTVPQDISHLRDVRPQILSSASRIGVSPPMISKVLR